MREAGALENTRRAILPAWNNMMIMKTTAPKSPDISFHCLQNNAQARLSELGREILRSMEHIRKALDAWSLPAVEAALKGAPALQVTARDIEMTCMSQMPGCGAELARFRLASYVQYARRLERVVHQIATMGIHLGHIVHLNAAPNTSTLLPLYLLAEIELRDALLAKSLGDENLARAVLERDRELDARFRGELEAVIRDLSLGLHETEVGLSLIFVLRAIERIGDHAKELASAALLQHGSVKKASLPPA